MFIELLGILEDGSPRAATTPSFAQRQVDTIVGATLTVRISVIKADGTPMPLGGTQLALAVSPSSYADPFPTLKKMATLKPSLGPNWAEFYISSDDTKMIPPGRYSYAVWMYQSFEGQRDAVIPVSPWVLGPSGFLRPPFVV